MPPRETDGTELCHAFHDLRGEKIEQSLKTAMAGLEFFLGDEQAKTPSLAVEAGSGSTETEPKPWVPVPHSKGM